MGRPAPRIVWWTGGLAALCASLSCGASRSPAPPATPISRIAFAPKATPRPTEIAAPPPASVSVPEPTRVNPEVVGGPPAPEPPARVRLRLASRQRISPVAELSAPSPRIAMNHGSVRGWMEKFEREAPISTLAPAALAERWDQFVKQSVPTHLRPLFAQFFADPQFSLLRTLEERFGRLRSIEKFEVNAGQPAYLAVFEQTTATTPVSIFDKHHRYVAVRFDGPEGDVSPTWALDLELLFPGVLEMDDAQLGPQGSLFVNANYPSYAKEVQGETAYLYRIDPAQAQVRWRAGPLASRGEFLILDELAVGGYGFTAEPDFLFVWDRDSGKQLSRLRIPSAHDWIRPLDDRLSVKTYDAALEVEILHASK